ncbi:damage-inducible protein DinB [Mucilaginibacter rubeus]|uniref:Damage-inducible protein DinB n=1 Tax=Mucilaginibacter rubeus TaxID=2027860 RepID=A0AAE6JF56_9SPHI|nr:MULTISPECIES: DinB family protein [Mucilaginibacter]QEM04193.1 damage-inducible protein DinB [Mucilaginibacter rubeus]QEM16796.1 damage-inducible protein DinB [Mucilaginibacter gossypii]QTE46727.1 damage-inducible protein DinB [Mucilaginibacter rubeus]QTE53324.1 damage-inducible protein DinB [Mucilaginibacter rubeus]QTE58410.1 damage-inducible protein DinB [Mucilaginibacter rubeus]
METNAIQQPTTEAPVYTPDQFLQGWLGQRRVTRRLIEAFPEEALFNYSIGGMRPFSEMVKEIISMSGPGVKGLATNDWTSIAGLDHHTGKIEAHSKNDLLRLWDDATEAITTYWAQIPVQRFQETVLAFGQYEGVGNSIIQYIIDNEIHHRGQAYVYLRSLGIEPPAFYDRS